MVEFENDIVIQKPIGEVFAFLADPQNLPRWNYYVLEVKLVSGERASSGAIYHQVRKTDEEDLRLETVEPVHRVVIKTVPPSPISLEMVFFLEEEGSATRIRDLWYIDTGRPFILELLGRGVIKAAVAQNLGKLKMLLETGSVTLQDSRIATI